MTAFEEGRFLLLLLGVHVVLSSAAAQAQPIARPRITGLSHVALYVHDIEKSRAFYKDFLGYDEPYSLSDPDGKLHLTFIKINDRQSIELFPQKQPGADRLYHIAIETDDAEAMRVYLASRAVKVPQKTPRGRIGNANYFITDPDGHIVEIVQYEPDSWTIREKGKHLPETRISPHMTHCGILCGDLERSKQFYCDILGFRETWRGSRDGKLLSWVNLQVPDGSDYIELMLYEKLPEPERRGVQHHICLEVPSVPQAVQTLASRALPEGCKSPTPPRTGINGKRQANYYDPDGTRIELMEPQTADGKPAPSSGAPAPTTQDINP